MNQKRLKTKTGEALSAYLMILPDFIGLLIFLFVPILYALYISFFNWDGLSEMHFSGIKNYIALIKDDGFLNSLGVTLQYVIIYVPAVFIVSLLLALLVQAIDGKAQNIFRSLYFVPYSISTVVAATICLFLYDNRKGFFNTVLTAVGLPRGTFLSSGAQALESVAVVGIWLVCGYNMVIFLAAIKDVPRSYYEAAEIDGASSLRKFWNITLPSIRDTNIFVLVVTTVNSFQVFDQIKIMTAGGPGRATEVTVYYIFNQAFGVYRFGYASAASILLALIMFALTMIQFKITGMMKEG